MEPSWTAMKWIAGFGDYGMGEPSILTRSDSPDDQPVKNQFVPTITAPTADTKFKLKSSECVVGTITRFPVTQPSSVQQNNCSSSQLVAANRTIYSLHK